MRKPKGRNGGFRCRTKSVWRLRRRVHGGLGLLSTVLPYSNAHYIRVVAVEVRPQIKSGNIKGHVLAKQSTDWAKNILVGSLMRTAYMIRKFQYCHSEAAPVIWTFDPRLIYALNKRAFFSEAGLWNWWLVQKAFGETLIYVIRNLHLRQTRKLSVTHWTFWRGERKDGSKDGGRGGRRGEGWRRQLSRA
jgi:hypothetical protein